MGNPVQPTEGAKPAGSNATRDHLANERTLLAWLRTSIAIVALGFVVARFGLLIRELGLKAPRQASGSLSTAFGVALVVCGALIVVVATVRYRQTERAIDNNDYRPSAALTLLVSAGLIVAVVLLAIYLLVSG
ncbi:MAG: YidH family protein [Chloroflexota bacterium]